MWIKTYFEQRDLFVVFQNINTLIIVHHQEQISLLGIYVLEMKRCFGSLVAIWPLKELLLYSAQFTPEPAVRKVVEGEKEDTADLNAAQEEDGSGDSALQGALNMGSCISYRSTLVSLVHHLVRLQSAVILLALCVGLRYLCKRGRRGSVGSWGLNEMAFQQYCVFLPGFDLHACLFYGKVPLKGALSCWRNISVAFPESPSFNPCMAIVLRYEEFYRGFRSKMLSGVSRETRSFDFVCWISMS